MKNHPVNNDYVQNLQEGLLNETRRRPKGTPMGDLQAADSLRRRENSQEVLNHEVDADSGDLGRRTDDWEDEPLHGTRGSDRKLKKVRGAKNEKPATHNRGATTKRPIGNSAYAKDPATTKMYLKLAKERAAKRSFKKVDENAQAGYPEEGIKGGTPEARAMAKKKKKLDEDIDSRIISKIESAGGGAEFDKKKAEYAKKVADKRRERLAAEDSVQKESFDITDSRLSDEDAKIDQNVKTRGVKKVRGQKPVPMVNSAGETVGEQDAGHRPRSQDLNTRGRLNKSREGEGMLAKGKRFIKKKFA